jgi:DNA gyrase/topoisomerase IV subunit B
VNDRLFAECKNVIPYIDGSEHEYIFNDGQIVSLYTVMREFNSFMPPRLARFKGLGEMDPAMLGPSTLRPDGDRLLVQYTFENFEKELEEMRYINSNKDLLLKD